MTPGKTNLSFLPQCLQVFLESETTTSSSLVYNDSTSFTLALVDYYDGEVGQGGSGTDEEGQFEPAAGWTEPATVLQKIMSFQTYNLLLTIIQVGLFTRASDH